MALPTPVASIDFSDKAPKAARADIRQLLKADPSATRKVYAGLAHKVWTLLIECRLDAEVRDWHALLQSVRAFVASHDTAAAERLVALSDLLRESVSLAETSPARALVRRPHAKAILERLHQADKSVPRRILRDELKIGESHLSNVLTKLVAHGLINRRESGKEALFAITEHGREMLGVPLSDMRVVISQDIAEAVKRSLVKAAHATQRRPHRTDSLEDLLVGCQPMFYENMLKDPAPRARPIKFHGGHRAHDNLAVGGFSEISPIHILDWHPARERFDPR